jgi:hypothetical protein
LRSQSPRGGRTAFTLRCVLVVTALGMLSGCRRDKNNVSVAQAQAAPQASADQIGYPPAAWRNDRGQLEGSVVSLAHILIAHKDSNTKESNVWAPLNPRPTRSKQEALARARNVLELVRRDPASFDKLARQYSDDAATAELGGELGTWRASLIAGPMVDALAAIKPNEISRVFESPLGFHIVKRLEVPANEAVKGREILVTYADASAGWMRDGRQTQRSRAEAKALADKALKLAKAPGSDFRALAQEYSDAYNASADASFGPWKIHDRRAPQHAVATLRRMAVGEVSPLLDHRDGFRILQRLPSEPLIVLNTSEIIVLHNDSKRAMGDATVSRSRDEAQELASRILKLARKTPSRFGELRTKHCEQYRCKHPIVPWIAGQGIPGFDQAVAGLKVGEFAESPIETPLGYHVVRREASPELPDEKLVLEIPSPAPKSLDHYMTTLSPEALAAATPRVAEHAIKKLSLGPDEAARLRAILSNFAAALKTAPPNERQRLRMETRKELETLLGKERYPAFERARDEWMRATQLQ